MVNFKICIRNTPASGFCPVYVRITHNRTVAYLKTDKIVSREDVDAKGNVKDGFVIRYQRTFFGDSDCAFKQFR